METIPAMRARHRREIEAAIRAHAARRITQTEAARELGLSLTGLNNLIKRMGIAWPVKYKGETE